MDGPSVCRKVCVWKISSKCERCILGLDLETEYNMIDRQDMWQMVGAYGVPGNLFKAVQSFYVDSRAFVRVGMDVIE